MTTERRKSPRFSISQMIEMDIGREIFISAEGVNISEEGLLCHTSQSIEPYSRVYLQIALEGVKKSDTFSCEGVVVRCRKNSRNYDTALEFSELEDKDRKKIHRFIH